MVPGSATIAEALLHRDVKVQLKGQETSWICPEAYLLGRIRGWQLLQLLLLLVLGDEALRLAVPLLGLLKHWPGILQIFLLHMSHQVTALTRMCFPDHQILLQVVLSGWCAQLAAPSCW